MIRLQARGGRASRGSGRGNADDQRERRRPGRREEVQPELISLLRGETTSEASPFPMQQVLLLMLASTLICLTLGLLLAAVLGK